MMNAPTFPYTQSEKVRLSLARSLRKVLVTAIVLFPMAGYPIDRIEYSYCRSTEIDETARVSRKNARQFARSLLRKAGIISLTSNAPDGYDKKKKRLKSAVIILSVLGGFWLLILIMSFRLGPLVGALGGGIYSPIAGLVLMSLSFVLFCTIGIIINLKKLRRLKAEEKENTTE